MSDSFDIIAETVGRLFADMFTMAALGAAEGAAMDAAHWARIAELGLPMAMVAEEEGGVGLTAADAVSLMKVAGRFAVPLPLAETMLGNWLLGEAGLCPSTEPVAIAVAGSGEGWRLARRGESWRLEGEESAVPWASAAKRLAVLAGADDGFRIAQLEAGEFEVAGGFNLAGEPRDAVRAELLLPAARVGALRIGLDPAHVTALGAAMRAAAMAGAMERVLEITIAYAGERAQFGRPIGSFQAIQHYIAVAAGHVAAGNAAAALAAAATGEAGAPQLIAAAKIRAGEAAGKVAALAHQIHGAMGFTREYGLHHFTRRLWSWREEFGSEAGWSIRLGRAAAAAGPDGLWPMITGAAPAPQPEASGG